MNESDKERKKIVVQLEDFFLGRNNPKSLDDILDTLHSYRHKHKARHDKLWLESYTREDEYGHIDCGGIYLKGERLETFEERNKRVDGELLREARVFEKQRQEFEHLKNLFEPKEQNNEGDTQSSSG
jgi:uncharacterized protein YeeX (DUF496 family)